MPARLFAGAILVWFSWQIATGGPIGPMRFDTQGAMFLQGGAMQSVNPKAWAAGIAIATKSINPIDPVATAAMTGLVVFCVLVLALQVWAYSGQSLQGVLSSENRRKTFNYGMAAALLGIGLPGLFA